MRPLVHLLVLVLLWCPAAWAGEPVPLSNPNLQPDAQGVPRDWHSEVGATQDRPAPDPARTSQLRYDPNGVFGLEGDSDTRHWRIITHAVSVQSEAVYRFAFDTRSLGVDITHPGEFFPNCYVGAWFEDAAGQRLSMHILTVARATFEEDSVIARAPAGATHVRLAIFLSQPGRLEVRSVRMERLAPAESYDLLIEQMDRHYPFFAAHGIDWAGLAAAHRAPALAAPDATAFAEALRPLLAALKDLHVSVEVPGRPTFVPHAATVATHFDVALVKAQVRDLRQAARETISGHTSEGFGYIGIGDLLGSPLDRSAMDKALRGLLESPGLIIDLRPNRGGAEAWAQHLVGLLAREPVMYARSRYRAGRAHEAFYETPARFVRPGDGVRAPPPIAVLVGPGCVSSGEGFALALKALPGVALFGQPTRGASGNPQPLDLPNGVRVSYSRWMTLTPDGTPLERRGVAPTHPVAAAPDRDLPLEAARTWLRSQAPAGEGPAPRDSR